MEQWMLEYSVEAAMLQAPLSVVYCGVVSGLDSAEVRLSQMLPLV